MSPILGDVRVDIPISNIGVGLLGTLPPILLAASGFIAPRVARGIVLALPRPGIPLWHRLPAWSDTVSGRTRLRQRYVLTTLSNGGVGRCVHSGGTCTQHAETQIEKSTGSTPSQEAWLRPAARRHVACARSASPVPSRHSPLTRATACGAARTKSTAKH
jgi:hypothetical protein